MKKLHHTPLFLFLVLLNACATLTNQSRQNVVVYSNQKQASATINNNTQTLPATFRVTRSKENLQVKLKTDSLIREFDVKPTLSKKFKTGNLLFLFYCPYTYLVDLTNPRRFTYGDSIYLASDAYTNRICAKEIPKTFLTEKGQLYVGLSLPWYNGFYLQPEEGHIKTNTGFWGGSTLLEYYYHSQRSLEFRASYTLNYYLPLPPVLPEEGEIESIEVFSLSLIHNHKFSRWFVGYGIQTSQISYANTFNPGYLLPPPENELTESKHLSVGLETQVYRQVSKSLFIGIRYTPSFFELQPKNQFCYEHVLSLDFAWKLRMK